MIWNKKFYKREYDKWGKEVERQEYNVWFFLVVPFYIKNTYSYVGWHKEKYNTALEIEKADKIRAKQVNG